MTPKEKAIELISDYSEMIMTSVDLETDYEFAKIYASYAANTAKWCHESDSLAWAYWEKVKQEIKNL